MPQVQAQQELSEQQRRAQMILQSVPSVRTAVDNASAQAMNICANAYGQLTASSSAKRAVSGSRLAEIFG